MITVTQQSEHRYVISDVAGNPLGWTGSRTIGFGPFTSESAAFDAAGAVWPLLQSGLARHFPGWERVDVAPARLRAVHDGAWEWISDGRVPLARLFRPGSTQARRGFAIELVLPSFASDGVAIALAPVLARAVAPLLDAPPGAPRLAATPELSPPPAA